MILLELKPCSNHPTSSLNSQFSIKPKYRLRLTALIIWQVLRPLWYTLWTQIVIHQLTQLTLLTCLQILWSSLSQIVLKRLTGRQTFLCFFQSAVWHCVPQYLNAEMTLVGTQKFISSDCWPDELTSSASIHLWLRVGCDVFLAATATSSERIGDTVWFWVIMFGKHPSTHAHD